MCHKRFLSLLCGPFTLTTGNEFSRKTLKEVVFYYYTRLEKLLLTVVLDLQILPHILKCLICNAKYSFRKV